MKKLLLSLTTLAALTTAASAQLFITEAMSNSSHAGGAGNGDWFEIYNAGSTSVDLSNYSWDDDSATAGTHAFGNVSIAAGGFLLVVDENDTLIGNWIADVWGLTTSSSLIVIGNGTDDFSGLGSGGDTIYLYDGADEVVSSFAFGDSTDGVSFEWDFAASEVNISTLGENGAYTALLDGNDDAGDDTPSLYSAGSDIASPGAIPEPATYAAIFGALALSIAIVRRQK
jgi:hypothetical protein